MSLSPLVATLLVDMNFMVIRTDGNFWRKIKDDHQATLTETSVINSLCREEMEFYFVWME